VSETTGALVLALRGRDGTFLANPPLQTPIDAGYVLIAISGPQIHGVPERRKRPPSAIRRAAAIIRANAVSAVVSVSTSGVLQARTSCLVQASTSMLSKPTA